MELKSIIKWIPVTKKMPDKFRVVCVMARLDENVFVDFAKHEYNDIWLTEDGNIFTRGFVTHWGIPESVSLTDITMFTTQTAHRLCGIKRRQFYYWIKDGKIDGRRDESGNRWLFSLSEINRIRVMRGMEPLTVDESLSIWKDYLNVSN